jgi:hypothetical protein
MGDPPVEYVGHDGPVPRLPVAQVYGWLLCPISGRVLIREQDDGTFSLPGGTPEPSTPTATPRSPARRSRRTRSASLPRLPSYAFRRGTTGGARGLSICFGEGSG